MPAGATPVDSAKKVSAIATAELAALEGQISKAAATYNQGEAELVAAQKQLDSLRAQIKR